jgi:anti-sigma regulatory factor (Ser/Thr protein kinase)
MGTGSAASSLVNGALRRTRTDPGGDMDIGRPIRTSTIEPRGGMSVRLRFPADLGSLADGRDAVRRALRRQRCDGEGAELVVLAVCEALTNAIEHGSVPGEPIEIEIAAAADHAEIRVTDRGRPGAACPLGVPAPPPPGAERGRGLIIMSALADALEIRRAGRGTELRLRFAAAAASEASSYPRSPGAIRARSFA